MTSRPAQLSARELSLYLHSRYQFGFDFHSSEAAVSRPCFLPFTHLTRLQTFIHSFAKKYLNYGVELRRFAYFFFVVDVRIKLLAALKQRQTLVCERLETSKTNFQQLVGSFTLTYCDPAQWNSQKTWYKSIFLPTTSAELYSWSSSKLKLMWIGWKNFWDLFEIICNYLLSLVVYTKHQTATSLDEKKLIEQI